MKRLVVPRPIAVLWDWTKSVGATVLIFLVLRTFVMEGFHIPSGSMERTLLVGDWLFVNKALYGAEVPFIGARLPAIREPARGEIVVFDSKEDDNKVVKRLVGMPGDTLEMRAGHLYRNGREVAEPYAVHIDTTRSAGPFREQMREWQVRYLVGRDPRTYVPDLQDWGPIVVPAESLFVMGDNRENSYDSRYWGFLSRASVRGTPMFIYFSCDAESFRQCLGEIRWNRFFCGLH
jgi:signal peptidase I